MRFKNLTKIGTSLALVLALGAPMAVASSSPAANVAAVDSSVNWYAPGRVSDLLENLQEINAKLATHGQTLDSFARTPGHSWQSHAHYLSQVRDQVNEAGKIISELQSIQHGALPWQQQAIARIHPLALDLAKHTSEAIAYLADNQNRLFVPEYREHLAAISDRATEMRTTVNNFVDYGAARQQAQTLGQKLEIAGS